MGDSFQDVVVLRTDGKLELLGEAIIIAGTGTEAQSVIFSNTPGGAEGHLAWNPSVHRTLSLPDANGTIILSGQAVNGIGVSTGGNTLGNTGTIGSGNYVLAGIGNLTLSQVTGTGGATVTISVAGAANDVQALGVSTSGNTLGNTGTMTGTILFAATNGITLSQATNLSGGTITVLGKKRAPILFFGTGRYRVSSGVDIQEAGDEFTIAYVVLRREIAGETGTTLIDVLKNGVSIWNVNPGNRPSVTAAGGDDQRVTATPDVTTISSTDRLEVEIVTVETGSPQDLVVELIST